MKYIKHIFENNDAHPFDKEFVAKDLFIIKSMFKVFNNNISKVIESSLDITEHSIIGYVRSNNWYGRTVLNGSVNYAISPTNFYSNLNLLRDRGVNIRDCILCIDIKLKYQDLSYEEFYKLVDILRSKKYEVVFIDAKERHIGITYNLRTHFDKLNNTFKKMNRE
jgi:hypothetical protein